MANVIFIDNNNDMKNIGEEMLISDDEVTSILEKKEST
jgi:hypothetical protein